MRQGQSNKRMRGRNRKGPNPLTRSYESNGPDVKIRGTAQHIAEKYSALSRDALSAGDPVASENYLQHAEHYFRIIASAQAQMQANAQQQQQHHMNTRNDNMRNDDQSARTDSQAETSPESAVNGSVADPGAPQPVVTDPSSGDTKSSAAKKDDRPSGSEQDGDTDTARPRRRRRPMRSKPMAADSDGEQDGHAAAGANGADTDATEATAKVKRPRRRPAAARDEGGDAETAAASEE